MGVLCPRCKTVNTGENPFCVECGAELNIAGRIQELEDKLIEQDLSIERSQEIKENSILCAYCNWEIDEVSSPMFFYVETKNSLLGSNLEPRDVARGMKSFHRRCNELRVYSGSVMRRSGILQRESMWPYSHVIPDNSDLTRVYWNKQTFYGTVEAFLYRHRVLLIVLIISAFCLLFYMMLLSI